MIDVLVVDDNAIVREGLRGYLDATGDVRVVAEAGNGRDAVAVAARLRPAVTLLDHRMPLADGLSVVSTLSRLTAVLVLTSDASDDLVLAMLRGGARGYLVHGRFEPADLHRAVHAVASGQGWLCPSAASAATSAVRGHAGRRERARDRYGLSVREREVVELLCHGLSNVAIAGRLGLTEKTVKNHLHHVYAKLGVANRTEAVLRWDFRPIDD